MNLFILQQNQINIELQAKGNKSYCQNIVMQHEVNTEGRIAYSGGHPAKC